MILIMFDFNIIFKLNQVIQILEKIYVYWLDINRIPSVSIEI